MRSTTCATLLLAIAVLLLTVVDGTVWSCNAHWGAHWEAATYSAVYLEPGIVQRSGVDLSHLLCQWSLIDWAPHYYDKKLTQESTIVISRRRLIWPLATQTAGEYLILGGTTGSAGLSGKWISTDYGATWATHGTQSWPNGNIMGTAQAWLDASTIVMAGGTIGASTYTARVYTSTDNGATFTSVTTNGGFGNRRYAFMFTHSGVAYIMGGYTTLSATRNDIWSSSDGVTWTEVTSRAPWPTRGRAFYGTNGGTDYIVGGQNSANLNDVWTSTDGTTWTEVTSRAEWTSRGFAGVVWANSRMYVFGGQGSTQLNDVWTSTDSGVTWHESTSRAPWRRRFGHAAISDGTKIHITLGGDGSTNYNDNWILGDGSSLCPATTPTTAGSTTTATTVATTTTTAATTATTTPATTAAATATTTPATTAAATATTTPATTAATTAVTTPVYVSRNISLTLSGTVESFDPLAFKQTTALAVGLAPNQIEILSIQSASVRVIFRLVSNDVEAASARLRDDLNDPSGVLHSNYQVQELHFHHSGEILRFCGSDNGGCLPGWTCTPLDEVGKVRCTCEGDCIKRDLSRKVANDVGNALSAAVAVALAAVGGTVVLSAISSASIVTTGGGNVLRAAQTAALTVHYGDNSTVDPSYRLFASKFDWTNYHIGWGLDVDAAPDDIEGNRRRRLLVTESVEIEEGECVNAKDLTNMFLDHTITCAGALACVFVIRAIMVATLGHFAKRRNKRRAIAFAAKHNVTLDSVKIPAWSCPPLLVFPRWELVIFLSQHAGWSESAGIVVSSRCNTWIAVGAVTFLLLPLATTIFAIYLVVRNVKIERIAEFVVIQLRQDFKAGWQGVKEAQGFGRKLVAVYQVVVSIRLNGDWSTEGHTQDEELRYVTKVDAFVGSFRTAHAGYSIFAFYLLKQLMTGLVAASNWSALAVSWIGLGVQSFEFLLVAVLRPFKYRTDNIIQPISAASGVITMVGLVIGASNQGSDNGLMTFISSAVAIGVNLLPAIFEIVLFLPTAIMKACSFLSGLCGLDSLGEQLGSILVGLQDDLLDTAFAGSDDGDLTLVPVGGVVAAAPAPPISTQLNDVASVERVNNTSKELNVGTISAAPSAMLPHPIASHMRPQANSESPPNAAAASRGVSPMELEMELFNSVSELTPATHTEPPNHAMVTPVWQTHGVNSNHGLGLGGTRSGVDLASLPPPRPMQVVPISTITPSQAQAWQPQQTHWH